MTDYNLSFVRRYPYHCEAEVTRDGESQPCDKPAVAVRTPEGDETHPWPCCAYHTRVGHMVPLAVLLGVDHD